MKDSDRDVKVALTAIAAAYGLPAWGTALGVGSFLTVEFGAQIATPGPTSRVHGEFHLWVYCTAWRIETGSEVIACSEDPRSELEAVGQYLDRRILAEVSIDQPSLSGAFAFADGTLLRTFTIYSREYEHWMFYLPSGEVFTAGPGTTWSLGR